MTDRPCMGRLTEKPSSFYIDKDRKSSGTSGKVLRKRGAGSESFNAATNCATCGGTLPRVRRVIIQGEGIVCYPCHAKRWDK